MGNLTEALNAWREILGSEHVTTDPDTVHAAETATFSTEQTIPAILRPGSREEVQACVRAANEHGIPVYPVSRGRNWGYGSRVPVQDGCALMELHRLDAILAYDERLAYVTVEPGVTFRQLHEFLRSQNSNLIAPGTGSTAEASVLGNAIERGFGGAVNSDRFAQVCGLEVVLPTGEYVNTGFGRFPGAKSTGVYRWGVGPYTDGIFTQSNLGIVTQMTIWLAPKPNFFRACYFAVNDEARLEGLIDTLQQLKLHSVIRSSIVIHNSYRVLNGIQQYPWEALDGKTPLPAGVLERIRRTWWRNKWWAAEWISWVSLFSASREQADAERTLIESALADQVDRLVFVDDTEVQVSRWEEGRASEKIERMFRAVDLEKTALFSVPTDSGVFATYWRKKMEPPPDMNPDRDRCGYMWCAPVVPLTGEDVRATLKIMADAMVAHQFEPFLTIHSISERCAHVLSTIVYDRDVAGEDERALACHDQMFRNLVSAGYIPYRLGIQSMDMLPASADDYDTFVRKLKSTLDPNDILAPGRYISPGDGRANL